MKVSYCGQLCVTCEHAATCTPQNMPGFKPAPKEELVHAMVLGYHIRWYRVLDLDERTALRAWLDANPNAWDKETPTEETK